MKLFHFFRKVLMSAFLLRFLANYLGKIRGYPYFSLRILCKDILFPHGPNLIGKNRCIINLVVTVLWLGVLVLR